jgi:hypothetical protein
MLKQEYDRDVANGTPINVPANYYPEDDPSQPPRNRWRSHAHLLYSAQSLKPRMVDDLHQFFLGKPDKSVNRVVNNLYLNAHSGCKLP